MTGFVVIKTAAKAVLSICGEQDYDESIRYRWSAFVVAVRNSEGMLYHSCLTGELVEVTDESYARAYLVRHWFLVKEGLNERELVPKIKKLMKVIGHHQTPGYSTFEIIPTTVCNARCYYCYEQGFKSFTMDKKTAEKTVDFIAEHKNSNKIRIKWYGGEPLVNMPAIDVVSLGLFNKGIDFDATMISNGFLFSNEVLDKAKHLWRLLNVRITIDGTENVYNVTKNFWNSTGSAFRIVLNNIDCLLDNSISVTIRVNIEKKNIEDANLLLGILCEKYAGAKNLDFMLRPLNNTDCNGGIESHGVLRDEILKKITSMKYRLHDYGFDVNCGKLSGMTFFTCIADSGKYIAIKPNGELAYCSADFDKKQFGSIFDKSSVITNPPIGNYLYEKEPICSSCPLYPICSPSKLCPSCSKPFCNEAQKNYNISDIKLTMSKLYRQYKQNNAITQ